MYLPGKINKSTGSLANKTAKTKSISIISIEVHNPALDFTFEKKMYLPTNKSKILAANPNITRKMYPLLG